MKYSALLFDFDGVILDTEWSIYQTWLQIFQQHQQDLPLETYIQCIGSDFETWSPETHLEQLTGQTFDWQKINATRQTHIETEVAKLHPMPGLLDLLAHAKQTNLPCAVVSSSSHNWVDRWLDQHHLTSSFQHIICRGDAPRIKPAPDLFLEAVQRLNLPPQNCLVIEDSLNGLKAAQAAGCPIAAIPNRITSCIDFSQATHQFPTLTELLHHLQTTT